MTFSETLAFLYQQLPMYQRVGPKAFKKDLVNIIKLCEALNNPQEGLTFIHIAGTNGKGSVSNMMASVLQECGYKVGLYTSPHLKNFTERIRINGKEMPEIEVIDFVDRIKPAIQEIGPSFFELTVGMAFDYFQRQEVDIAVIEVGLGGRLDSTNIIQPILGAITNISYDHTGMLGETLPEIAGEKAGIIKPGITYVIGQDHPETRPVFIEKAKREGAELVFAPTERPLGMWKYIGNHQLVGFQGEDQSIETYELGLAGDFQIHNLRVVVCMAELLNQNSPFDLPLEAVKRGFLNVSANTGFKGRMTTLSQDPLVLTDTGHNPAGVQEVLKAFQRIDHEKLHIVWGMVFDKDYVSILDMLPKDAIYYFVRPAVPRGLDVTELATAAQAVGLKGNSFSTVQKGLEAAKSAADPQDLVFVGGSTFVVAEVV